MGYDLSCNLKSRLSRAERHREVSRPHRNGLVQCCISLLRHHASTTLYLDSVPDTYIVEMVSQRT
jgi:hypothetical protein